MAEKSLIMYRDEAYQHEKKCVTNWLQIKGLIFFFFFKKAQIRVCTVNHGIAV